MSGESVESQIIKDIRREYAKTYPSVMFTLTNRIEAQEAELAALRAENQRLTKEKQDEFEIGSRYYELWQKVAAENARYREALEPFSLHAAALMAKHYAAMTEISSVGHSHLVAGACFDARFALSGAPAGIFLSLEQAREIEWAGWDDTLHVECCPACMTTANLGDDHAPDCWLARAIKQAEEAHGQS